ncbi:DUF4350 domain-containing protein [Salinibacterium sp. G-O1]|uniref:DUF4350 domain-containing protein n=1 Tax=Salinibacterium sp. G-O1 TaxID=3046208 RepID=UPI0024BA1FC4|nr:DUF4350 domain-containing protein [Salinibacterium sp. G-O1]MDJ0335880.1 DUF4350 domain-containing protein [Salinibacterium sp. G-O1]
MTTQAPDQQVLTRTIGRVAKRALFWVVVVVFVVAIALVSLSTVGSNADGPPLDPDSASPGGSMAVAEVLRQQGVDVVVASTLVDARDAVNGFDDTTVLLYDPKGFLDDDQLRDATTLARTVIVVDAHFTQLQAIAPEVRQAGRADAELTADCDLPAAVRAGAVSGEAYGYRIVDGSAAAVTCFGSGDGVFSLIQVSRDGAALTLLGLTDALTNEHVIDSGNAAMALNLLGSKSTLVWYLPTLADVPDDGDANLGELTPAWVGPVLLLLVLTFVSAAVWRGRRFGPLVIENLPVTVRSSETMLGRARLYERSSSRLRALDALRVGTIQRLAALCGQPRTATVDEVISAAAAVTGAQSGAIRNLLIDAIPATDADLVSLSDALLVLEHNVAAAVHP